MILYDYVLKMPDAFLPIVCQSSDVLQRMIILSVRALDTDHSKERTSQRLTQIPLSRAKMKGMSRVFSSQISWWMSCQVLRPYPVGLGSGSSRDVRAPSVFECHASWCLVMQHFQSQFFCLCRPCWSANSRALVKLYIIFALQKTHVFGEYVLNQLLWPYIWYKYENWPKPIRKIGFMCRKQISKDSK